MLLCVFVTTANLSDVFLGLVYMWICFLVLYIAYRGKSHVTFKSCGERRMLKNHTLVLILILVIALAICWARFYTGMSPQQVIQNLRNSVSNYYVYQSNLRENNLGDFSLKKIPFVLMNGMVEFLTIYIFVSFSMHKRYDLFSYIIRIIVLAGKLYCGLARGTNFELFQVAFIVAYFIWTSERTKTIPVKTIVGTIAGAGLCIFLFVNIIALRGAKYGVIRLAGDAVLDEANWIVIYSRLTAYIICRVGAYLAIGTFYLTHYLNNYFIGSIDTLTYGCIPGINYFTENYQSCLDPFLDRIAWVPDFSKTIQYFGLMGGGIVFFFFGRLLRMFDGLRMRGGNIYLEMLSFYIVYEIFSMPISRFIMMASSSKVSIFFICVCFICTQLGFPRVGTHSKCVKIVKGLRV